MTPQPDREPTVKDHPARRGYECTARRVIPRAVPRHGACVRGLAEPLILGNSVERTARGAEGIVGHDGVAVGDLPGQIDENTGIRRGS